MRIEHFITASNHDSVIGDDTGVHPRERLLDRIATVARSLRERSVSTNEVVILLAGNGAGFVEGLLGITCAGATAAVIDPALPACTIESLIRSTRSRILCCSGRRPAAHGLALSNHEILDVAAPSDASSSYVLNQPLSSNDESLAVILYSSGTTGEPKGIALSHRAVERNVRAIAEYLRPSPADSFLILKSMVHSSTLVGEVLVALATGARIFAPDPLVASSLTVRRIRDLKPTIIGMNPSILGFFVRDESSVAALQSVRQVHISGSIVEPDVLRVFRARFPFIQVIVGYGLTEAGPRVSCTGPSSQNKQGCVGHPIRDVQVEVRRKSGEGCAPCETGEVFVRSPSLFEGYLIAGELEPAVLQEGFFATGDLGYRDEQGDLFITGRIDDLIVTGSHKVNPADVEGIVRRVTDVTDCVVFGVDDPVLGKRVVCAYSTEQSTPAAIWRIESEIRAACRGRLAPFQAPRNLLQWEVIPAGPGGKKSRHLARQQYVWGKRV